MADIAAEVKETVATTEKEVEKVEKVLKDEKIEEVLGNGKAAENGEATEVKTKNGDVAKEDEDETEAVKENGSSDSSESNGSIETPLVCGLKRKSEGVDVLDAAGDTVVDAVVEKKQKIEDAVDSATVPAEVAANGNADKEA